MSAPRTRAEEARRIVGRLREAFDDMGDCIVVARSGRESKVSATLTGAPRHVYTIDVVIEDPDAPSTL